MTQTNFEVLAARFDPRVMADQQCGLIGHVLTKSMLRLKNTVVAMAPMVTARLQFSRDLYGYVNVKGQIEHALELRCERCLDVVNVDLLLPIEVLIKPASTAVPKKISHQDCFEYDGNYLQLAALIEDELLLALPLATKHQNISLCNQDMIAWLATNEDAHDKYVNPFAILKR